MTTEKVSTEFLRRRLADLEQSSPQSVSVQYGGGNGPQLQMSDERIGRLEGAMEGLKHSQNVMLGAIGLLVAIVVGLGVYGITRLDQLSDRVNSLPGQIGAELRDITRTLAESITAAKQQPPQVILLPAVPQQTPTPPQPEKK
jgi:hypothetical protein